MAARLIVRPLLVGLMTAVVVGCAPSGGAVVAPTPVPTVGPVGTVGPVVAQTRAELVRALGGRNLVLRDSQAPFRPPEDARFASTPRALYQVILPADTAGGLHRRLRVRRSDRGRRGGVGPGRLPGDRPGRGPDRRSACATSCAWSAPTVVMYSWVPSGAEDPLQPDIQVALETLGTGVPVPS